MAYSRFDALEIMMQQDDKIAAQLEEVDAMIDKKIRFNQDVIEENAYMTEHLEEIDYNTLDEIDSAPASTDMIDIEVDDMIDANCMDDDMGSLIDIVAEL